MKILQTNEMKILIILFFITGCASSDRNISREAVRASGIVSNAVGEQMQDIADTAVTARDMNESPDVDTGLRRIEKATGRTGRPDLNKLDPANLSEVQDMLDKTADARIREAENHAKAIADLKMEHTAALRKAQGQRANQLSNIFTRISAGLCLSGVLAIGAGFWAGRPRLAVAGGIGFAAGLLMGAAGLVVDHWLMPWVVWGSVIITLGVTFWIAIDTVFELRKKKRLEILQDSQVPAIDYIRDNYPGAFLEIKPLLKRAGKLDPKTEFEVAKRQT